MQEINEAKETGYIHRHTATRLMSTKYKIHTKNKSFRSKNIAMQLYKILNKCNITRCQRCILDNFVPVVEHR